MEFKYRGARAMVMLHEKYMREFLETWRAFHASGRSLPQTDDSDYVSTHTLLVHALRAARGYMTWMCQKLELPDPQIKPTPGADEIESQASDYLDHVLEQWRKPLMDIEEDRFGEVYKARWGVDYCIDAMLEHAVMHPIRHTFQLRELMAQQ
jgi:uncharacterized damage-inducible protein DinB